MQMDAHMYTPVNKALLVKSVVIASNRRKRMFFSTAGFGMESAGLLKISPYLEKSWELFLPCLRCNFDESYCEGQ